MRIRSRARAGVEGVWRAAGWADDVRSRVGTISAAFTAAVVAGTATIRGFGVILGIVIGLCVAGFVVSTYLVFSPRPAPKEDTGTLIPPGHNAIVTGEPDLTRGEWVPPGYTVTMGRGAVSDELGNSISGGTGNRIYFAEGATVGGINNVAGSPRWPVVR